MKKVLVTGGSRGIGAEICRAFAADGCKVFINYRSSKECAEKLASELGATAIYADVSCRADVEKMLCITGGTDVLINNAGIAQQSLFTDITAEDWERMINVNLGGVFNCCKAALPYMINKKSGCIINISSVWGLTGASCEVHYSASKAGVIGLTKALAKELAPSGINVNCIAPGVIDTDMNRCFSKEEIKMITDDIPLGRMGSAAEIADCALYLANKGGYITGQIISPNGGTVI